MKSNTKNKFITCFIAIAIALLAFFFSSATKAYAYNTAHLPTGNNVINLDNDASTQFTEKGLNQLAETAGYADLKAMMDSATAAGTSLTANFTNKVVRLGKDTTAGGTDLKWVPVYLSRSEEDKNGDGMKDAVLTLWLANDVYKSTWSDGTRSTDADGKLWNGSTIYCNTYDGSFIRHKLNGKNGWTTSWGDGEWQENANDNIRTLVSNFYGSGAFADCVTTPANVSWQANANKQKNDPEWNASGVMGTKANYPCDWLNDNVWLPSMYEVCDSTIVANSIATTFTTDGGLWQVNKGSICSNNNEYSWLRSGYPTYYQISYILDGDGNRSSNHVAGAFGVRPAIHINLETALNSVHTHDWDVNADTDADGWKVTKQATCSAKGLKERVCTAEDCPLTDSKETEEIPINPAAHNLGAAATCTTDQICTLCKTVIVQKTGHTYSDDWTSDATNHWHAATCGHTTETSGFAVHTWDSGTVTKPAKCNEEGVTTYTCTICSKTKTEPISKIAHTSSDWIQDKAPTCTAAGSKHKECTVCHISLETEAIDKIAHTPGDEATCTTAQTCTVCGTELAPKLGHNYEAAEGGVAPTCTTAGSGKVVCTRCNDEQVGASIPALGHIEVTDEAKVATCTETGLTEGKHCSRCEEVLTAQTEVPALGHDWATEWSKDETNHWHICSRCDKKNDEEAHTYDWVITKDPTEDEEGEKEEYCTICEYANGNKETIAKLVKDPDGNGDVIDLPVLPPNQDYDLEIAVKESESKYNIEGLNKGYLVELFIVDGEDRNPYDDSKTVTLTLLVPDGMEEFTLYRMSGDRLTEISSEEYTVNGGIVTIRTTLPSEFVFNAPILEQPSAGIPWWVWLIVGLVVVAIVGVIIIIIVVAKKKNNDGGTPMDNSELLSRLDSQEQKIDELLGRDDGGFNTPVELDENGNVIFK